MKVTALTHKGMVREKNEDYFYIDEKDHVLFVVADGMGGYKAGEVASKMAVETLVSEFKTAVDEGGSVDVLMKEALQKANDQVYDLATSDRDYENMGTTVTAAVFKEDMVYFAHIGDSRAYYIKNGQMQQLTKDHSLVAEMVRSGALSEEEAEKHPNRNIITNALGTEKLVRVDLFNMKNNRDAVFILCSDGLTNMVKDEEIMDIVNNCDDINNGCDRLVALANERGGIDNITLVIIDARPAV